MFDATYFVLENIIEDGNSSSQKSEADGVYDIMTFIEVVFILHLMREHLWITDDLSQALQRKSQDILNAMHLVYLTKRLLQKFRHGGWKPLLENVKSFYGKHNIEISDMGAFYIAG